MKKFYLLIEKLATVSQHLTYGHYIELLPYDDVNKINYYINQTEKQSLSIRQLREKIKNKEYERLSEVTKKKIIKKENDTVGIIICKEDNGYVIKYCSDNRIIAREYELI